MEAVQLARWSCGIFFLIGMGTGVWKYLHIMRSPEAIAPTYINIAHRAGLMYAFSCLILAYFAELSRWNPTINLIGVAIAVFFFFTAQATYILHGLLRDTDNQLQRPITLGNRTLPTSSAHAYIIALTLAEMGGFSIVFTGAVL